MTTLISSSTKNKCNAEILHTVSTADFNRLYRENKDFREFATKVYHYLEYDMKPGTKFSLKRYCGEKLRWLLITFTAFLFDNLHWLEYHTSDDYEYICRPYQSRELIEMLRNSVIRDLRLHR